jgi:hypothetical protein
MFRAAFPLGDYAATVLIGFNREAKPPELTSRVWQATEEEVCHEGNSLLSDERSP